jgi:hypothetical protein
LARRPVTIAPELNQGFWDAFLISTVKSAEISPILTFICFLAFIFALLFTGMYFTYLIFNTVLTSNTKVDFDNTRRGEKGKMKNAPKLEAKSKPSSTKRGEKDKVKSAPKLKARSKPSSTKRGKKRRSKK